MTVLVRAPITDPGMAIASETMHAAEDPAADDQAILLNAPFFADGLNFGDVVRLGPPDAIGYRPILEVVIASGHARILVSTGRHAPAELVSTLTKRFPEHALRIEGGGESLLCVSVHPELDPHDVFEEMVAWLDDRGALEDGDVALSPILETEVGALE